MYKIVKPLLLLVFMFSAMLPTVQAQGLAERRAIKQYQDEKLPDLQKQINEAAGFEVPVVADWDKLAVAGQAENYMNDGFITNIFFVPLVGALKEVGSDEMGKSALKEKLKGIKITSDDNAPASNYSNGVAFDSGTLTLNFKTFSNADDVKPRTEAIKAKLEAGL